MFTHFLALVASSEWRKWSIPNCCGFHNGMRLTWDRGDIEYLFSRAGRTRLCCLFRVRVRVVSFASVFRIFRIFCASDGNAFCWCNEGRHNSPQKDANVKDANAKDAEWTRKTRLGCEFSLILKFKALATKKRTVLLTVFTHSPMHTDARRNSISGTHAELRNRLI